MSSIQPGRPQRMNVVEDGIVWGWVEQNRHECDVCHHITKCIGLNRVQLPEGITIDSTILWLVYNRPGRSFHYIGIGCGCYAKFHRQVAHIMDSIKARS